MGNNLYTLVPMEIGSFNAFGIKRGKTNGCAVRSEYERWERISERAAARGVEMDVYNKMMYGHRCPLVRKASVVGSAKM